MKQLWAPWRMEYIRDAINNDDKTCFLCKAYSERTNPESLVVAGFKHTFVVMNKFPYNNGHLMIVPIKHVGSIQELESETRLEMMNIIAIATEILKEKMNAEGFNIGINLGKVAGAGIPDHIHIHIVPRWNGDTNYMPVFSDTKVISQGLKETYEIIKQGFEEVNSEI